MAAYDDIEVAGPEREDILRQVDAQLREWAVTMPAVEPLVLHFGLNRFAEIGETEFWVANAVDQGYCGKFLFVFDGQTCPYHHHAVKHETFFVVRGAIRMVVDDKERTMRDGDSLAMPPGIGHSFTGLGPALILEVSMPSLRGDNFFRDRRIGDDGVI